MSPFFSIIIPIYNAEKNIQKCIESLLVQEYKDFEIVLVNDGSTDNSRVICEKYADGKKVRLINQTNAGVSNARNTGVKNSLADYIIFIDADDYVSSDMCLEYYNILSKYDCDWIISKYMIDRDGEIISSYEKRILKKDLLDISTLGDNFDILYKAGLLNPPWSKCYSKKNIIELFDESISLGEDLLFNLNYLQNCQKVFYNDKPVYYYKVSSNDSLSAKYRNDGFQTLEYVLKKTLYYISNIWAENVDVTCVYDKFCTDCCVMAERLVKSDNTNKIKLLSSFFNITEVKQIYQENKINYGIKWNFYGFLLSHRMYRLFVIAAKIIQLGGKIKHDYRKNKS